MQVVLCYLLFFYNYLHYILLKNLYSGDLVDALRDYPEDRALLNKKSQKARKEVAAKQAATTTVVSKMSKNIIIRLNKEPAIVTALLKLMPKSSKVRDFYYFSKKSKLKFNFTEKCLKFQQENSSRIYIKNDLKFNFT